MGRIVYQCQAFVTSSGQTDLLWACANNAFLDFLKQLKTTYMNIEKVGLGKQSRVFQMTSHFILHIGDNVSYIFDLPTYIGSLNGVCNSDICDIQTIDKRRQNTIYSVWYGYPFSNATHLFKQTRSENHILTVYVLTIDVHRTASIMTSILNIPDRSKAVLPSVP